MVDFVPNTRLTQITERGQLTGSTIPRGILFNLGWPDSLMEDYDAKGNAIGEGNSDLVLVAAEAFQAQLWNRENQKDIQALDLRVTAAESNILSITARIETIEGQIVIINQRLDTAETNIQELDTRLTTAESNISDLQGRMTTAEGNITSLDTRLTAAESNINALSPQAGTLTPDGNITSNRSQTYYRIDGVTREIYFNPNVGVNTGWVLMS